MNGNQVKDLEALTFQGLLNNIGKLAEFLRERPWVGLGVLGTCIGAALMYAYFHSVEYVPADIVSVLGAGVAIAAVAIAYIIVLFAALAAPHAMYFSIDSLRLVSWRRWSNFAIAGNNFVFGIQLLSAGIFFSYVSWGLKNQCSPGVHTVLMPALTFLLLGSSISLHAGWGRVKWSWSFAVALVQLVMLGSLPLLILHDLLIPLSGVSRSAAGVWLLAWLGLILLFALLSEHLLVRGVLLFLSILFAILLWVIPMFNGDAGLFPRRVMELTGFRSREVLDLRVPSETCELIATAVADLDELDWRKGCAAERKWGKIQAQVLSNLGTRWWIQIVRVGDLAVSPDKILRMSIPAEGIQILQQKTALPFERRNQCTVTS